MLSRWIAVAAVVGLVSCDDGGGAAKSSKGSGGKIEFLLDVEAGLGQAKQGGKPAVLYFTADW